MNSVQPLDYAQEQAQDEAAEAQQLAESFARLNRFVTAIEEGCSGKFLTIRDDLKFIQARIYKLETALNER